MALRNEALVPRKLPTLNHAPARTDKNRARERDVEAAVPKAVTSSASPNGSLSRGICGAAPWVSKNEEGPKRKKQKSTDGGKEQTGTATDSSELSLAPKVPLKRHPPKNSGGDGGQTNVEQNFVGVSAPDEGLADRPRTTPVDSGSTIVKEQDLWLIQYHLFDRMTMSRTREELNKKKAGWGDLSSGQNASKRFRKNAVDWYAEQGVRRPWKLLSKSEREKARAAGKQELDYPFIDPRECSDSDIRENSADAGVAMDDSNQWNIALRSETSKPTSEQLENISSATNKKERVVQEDLEEDSEEKSEQNSEMDVEEQLEEEIMLHGPDPYLFPDKYDEIEITELDRIYAAANRVGNLTQIVTESGTLTAHKSALYKHCTRLSHLAAESFEVADIDVPECHQNILQAFFECFSPTPRAGLPVNIITFTSPTPPLSVPDPFGVIENSLSKYDFKRMVWDTEDCIELYKLAACFQCSHVKDLVASRIHWLYEEIKYGGPSQSAYDSKLLFDEDFINGLDGENDAPFLRLWADILVDTVNISRYSLHHYSDAVQNVLQERRATEGVDCLHQAKKYDFCARYHAHEADECHTYYSLLDDVSHMVKDIYHQLNEAVVDVDKATYEYTQSPELTVGSQKSYSPNLGIVAKQAYKLEERVMILKYEYHCLEKEYLEEPDTETAEKIFRQWARCYDDIQQASKECRQTWDDFEACQYQDGDDRGEGSDAQARSEEVEMGNVTENPIERSDYDTDMPD